MEVISSNKRFSIKQIFKDHWDNFVKTSGISIPGYVKNNVNKMLSCKDPDKLGYHKYCCPDHPKESLTIPHSCKSRFCNSCSKILTDNWLLKINSNLPNISYYHITFTISNTLRELFRLYSFLLSDLFSAASSAVLSWCKEKHFLPVVICVLHTFGKDLKFNSHIHMIISAGGLSLKNKNKFVYNQFIPYKMLQARWKVILLNSLKSSIKNYLKKNDLSSNDPLNLFSDEKVLNAFFEPLYYINWYVHMGNELTSPERTVSYVTRYAKRPPISETRILNYDGNFVTISYKERENSSPVKWTMPVFKFIKLLIQHILPKYFNVVRYYGLFANKTKTKLLNLVHKIIGKISNHFKFDNWRQRQISLLNKDPFICPVCNKEMILYEMAFFSKKKNALVYKSF